MIETRPDWCISRQRTWGVPIALFVHKETGELHPRTPGADRGGGRSAWRRAASTPGSTSMPAELLGADAAHYDKVTDVMDVWVDSGLSFECVGTERPEIAAPVDLYLEGSDQHRGWFHSSLLMSEALYERAPYKGVLTHGFTVDEKGRKMSKSLGNVIAPQKVMSTLGRGRAAPVGGGHRLRERDERSRTRSSSAWPIPTGACATPCASCSGNLHGFDPARARGASRRAAGARSLGAGARARAAGRSGRGVSRLPVPPDLPEGAQLLRRRPGRLLPGRAQGPPVHHAARRVARAARRRRRCSTSPRRWCAGWRRSCPSRPRRSGRSPAGQALPESVFLDHLARAAGGCRAHAIDWDALIAAAQRRARASWRSCATPARSARRSKPRWMSTAGPQSIARSPRWATSCASCSSPRRRTCTRSTRAAGAGGAPRSNAVHAACGSLAQPTDGSRSACAAGTGGRMWARTPSIRSCAGAASPMSKAPASRGLRMSEANRLGRG